MDLTKFFELQKELDAHIESEHPREPGEDRLSKKILALQVEIGELAQEWRGFKFWSSDQEPRNHFRQGLDGGKDISALLEEYVDCLHFILSIGLEKGLSTEYKYFAALYEDDVQGLFIQMMSNADVLQTSDHRFYVMMVDRLIALGGKLGFTWGQIEQAYFTKNATNHERQVNGY